MQIFNALFHRNPKESDVQRRKAVKAQVLTLRGTSSELIFFSTSLKAHIKVQKQEQREHAKNLKHYDAPTRLLTRIPPTVRGLASYLLSRMSR